MASVLFNLVYRTRPFQLDPFRVRHRREPDKASANRPISVEQQRKPSAGVQYPIVSTSHSADVTGRQSTASSVGSRRTVASVASALNGGPDGRRPRCVVFPRTFTVKPPISPPGAYFFNPSKIGEV